MQQSRFKDKFAYRIAVDERIDQERTDIPSLLLQPFVENAINHGLWQMDSLDGILSISIFAGAERAIVCTIDDNGVGRTRSRLLKTSVTEKKESYGNIMIKDLIDVFSRYENMRIAIEYIDKPLPQTGTTVTITIKYPKNDQHLHLRNY